MQRPRVKIGMSNADRVIEFVSASGLILMFAIMLLYYSKLPSTIPQHYNASGEPDAFGNKSTVWILPILAFAVYSILTAALKYSHRFNFPYEITEENAERQYKNSVLMLRILKLIIVFGFCYLTYATVQNGLGEMNGIGVMFLPVFLVMVFGVNAIFIYRGFRLR